MSINNLNKLYHDKEENTNKNIELNNVYQMDNLDLLQQLDSNSIDLIYCDILYNTGRKFKDYDDNLGTPQQAIEWYEPRLREMHRVLKDTGSIYLQMDHRLSAYMRVKMDEIFGFDNFRNEIVWKRGHTVKNSSSKQFPRSHDTILFYSKYKNKNNFNILYGEYSEGTLKNYNKDDNDGKGRYRLQSLRTYSEKSIEKFRNKGLIYESNSGKLWLKQYLADRKGAKIDSFWSDITSIEIKRKEQVGYDTQKPKELLKRIILASSNEGDIVADFFCGSGTSMVVAKELGRQYIGCDISERAIEITKERLKNIN